MWFRVVENIGDQLCLPLVAPWTQWADYNGDSACETGFWMPVSLFSAHGEPFRLPAVSPDERQPDLVERIVDGLRHHPRVILDAATERDQQRTIAAGKVAGKYLKRATKAAVTSRGVLIEFDDVDFDDSYAPLSDEQEQWVPEPSVESSVERNVQATAPLELPVHDDLPDGQLPRRIPGAGPRPGPRIPRGIE